jgi:hypothetical protein
MNQIPFLFIVPPTKPFHFHPDAFERFLSLLNLDLKPPVRQEKGVGMVKDNFHSLKLLPPFHDVDVPSYEWAVERRCITRLSVFPPKPKPQPTTPLQMPLCPIRFETLT